MRDGEINFEYYKVFYHTARLGSITLAADILFLSQPAVSKSIAKLEHLLGCRLFSRTPHGVRLTPEGKVLYRHVSQAFEQFQLGEKKITEMLTLENGEIHIGATDTVLHYYLLPHLTRFHESHPGIRIHVTQYSTPDAAEALRVGKADLSIVNSPSEYYSDIVARPILDIQDIFLCGPDYRQSLTKRTLSLAELSPLPLICLGPGTCTWDYLSEFFRQQEVEMRPVFELSNNNLVLSFVERNFGIGIAIQQFAEESIAAERVFPLDVNPPIPSRRICVLTPAHNPISHAAEEFLHSLPQTAD